MINKPVTNEKLKTEIVRLEALNEAAIVRIKHYRTESANERQVTNAVRGLRYRQERIADLRNA